MSERRSARSGIEPLYALRNEFLHQRVLEKGGRVVYVNKLAAGRGLQPWAFLIPVGYIVIPFVAGTAAAVEFIEFFPGKEAAGDDSREARRVQRES